jgi:hypothetical protein
MGRAEAGSYGDVTPMLVLVPNDLSDAIYQKIDAQIALCPDAAPDRELFYERLIGYFNEHGVVPDFTLVKNA